MKAFDGYHPTVLLVYFCSVLLVAMFVTNPIIQLSALLGGILFCGMLLGRRALPGNIAFYLSMFVLVAITNPLFSHNGVTPLFFLNGNPVTLEAFVYGAAIGVTVIGVMLWCRSLGEIMTSDKLLWLFGRVLPKFSLILSMALRFIPLFRRQLRRVSHAQRAMGLYSSRGYVDRLRAARLYRNGRVVARKFGRDGGIHACARLRHKGADELFALSFLPLGRCGARMLCGAADTLARRCGHGGVRILFLLAHQPASAYTACNCELYCVCGAVAAAVYY